MDRRHNDPDKVMGSLVKILGANGQPVGTGFIIHPEGYLITCHHVIYQLPQLNVEYQKQHYSAEWQSHLSDPEVDVAILKINCQEASYVQVINNNLTALVSVVAYGFSQKELKNFPDGVMSPARELQKSAPANTLSTFPKKSSVNLGSNPWNIEPQPASSFQSYSMGWKVTPGMSGGPVFAADLGGVVGIIQSQRGKGQESYVIRWENIQKTIEALEQIHYILISDSLLDESCSPKLKEIIKAINDSRGDRKFIFVKTSEYENRRRYLREVHCGWLKAKDCENDWVKNLLEEGVPLILIQSKKSVDSLRRTLQDQKIKRNLEDLVYPLHRHNEIKGAIRWIINYYHDINRKSVQMSRRGSILEELSKELAIILEREARRGR